ncbi:MAG: polysaccharide biosynthesis C-terminal domain-containing protein, partial [Trueperaceae bacterium]
ALNAVALLPQVISQQFYPRLAFSWSAKRDVSELRNMATRQRLYTYIAVIPTVALIALLAPPIVNAFLPQYAPGIPAILVTALVPLVSTLGQGYGGILHVLNRQYWYIGAMLVAVLVNVVASLALVGPFGLVGVAMGTFIAFIVLAVARVALGSLALKRAVNS